MFPRDLRTFFFFSLLLGLDKPRNIYYFTSFQKDCRIQIMRDQSCVEYTDIFIHSFAKYLLSTYYVLGTVLWAGGTGENKMDNPRPRNDYRLLCGRDRGHADTDSNVLQRKQGEGETEG